jgi:hypothetical protein
LSNREYKSTLKGFSNFLEKESTETSQQNDSSQDDWFLIYYIRKQIPNEFGKLFKFNDEFSYLSIYYSATT